MLHANSESRTVALKWYNLSVMDTAYFDPSRDYLYFKCHCRGRICRGSTTCSLLLLANELGAGLARRLIYELDKQRLINIFCFHIHYHYTLDLAVKELLLVDSKKGMGDRAEAVISNFVPYLKLYKSLSGSLLDAYMRMCPKRVLDQNAL